MLKVFNCKGCHLAFSVGWFHYHRASDDGYWSRTLLVCNSCGTEYTAEHSFAVSFNRLFAQQEPIRCDLSKEEEPLLVPYKEWITAETSFSFPADLNKVECFHCHEIGILVSNWSVNETCPACGEQTVEFMGGLTT